MNLDWEEVEAGDLDGYNIYRDTEKIDDVSGRAPQNGSSLVSKTTFSDQEVKGGTEYFYAVTAVDEVGNESPPSENAQPPAFPTPVGRP